MADRKPTWPAKIRVSRAKRTITIFTPLSFLASCHELPALTRLRRRAMPLSWLGMGLAVFTYYSMIQRSCLVIEARCQKAQLSSGHRASATLTPPLASCQNTRRADAPSGLQPTRRSCTILPPGAMARRMRAADSMTRPIFFSPTAEAFFILLVRDAAFSPPG